MLSPPDLCLAGRPGSCEPRGADGRGAVAGGRPALQTTRSPILVPPGRLRNAFPHHGLGGEEQARDRLSRVKLA